MASLIFRITGDAGSFNQTIGGVSTSLDGLALKGNLVSNVMSNLGTKMTLGVTLPAIALGSAALKAAVDMDSLKRGLITVEGTAEGAAKQLKILEELARRPGLGFREVISGFTGLRAAGLDAETARRSLSAFGNALATVGKGKAELDGVTLALQQIATKSKFSAEEVNQLAERLPQMRVALQKAFGTADTEVIQKLGLSNIEIIKRIVTEFEKLPQATSGPRNAIDNFWETVDKTAIRIGDKLLPTIEKLLPRLEDMAIAVGNVVDGFAKLPDSIQNASLVILGLAIASGPIMQVVSALRLLKAEMVAMGVISAAAPAAGAVSGAAIDAFMRNTARLASGAGAVQGAVGSTATAFSALGVAAAAAGGVGVGALVYGLNNSKTALEQQKKAADEAADGMKRINDRFKGAQPVTNSAYEALIQYTKAIPPATKNVIEHGDSHEKAAKKVAAHHGELTKIIKQTFAAAVEQKSLSLILSDYHTQVGKAAKLAHEYNSTNLDGALAAAKMADAQFRLNRVLEDAPDLGSVGVGGKVPTYTAPAINGGDFGEFERSSLNIGEVGMQTREQYEAMKRAAQESSRVQVAAMRQVSTVITDLSRGITDVIFKGGKMKDMFRDVASQAAQSITRLLIEGALTNLGKKLLDVGGLFGKVFGGGTGAIMSATSGGASAAAGGVASAGGAAASGAMGATSGLLGAIGAVAQVGTLISGIVGNFQNARQENTLNAIEKEVRFSQIHLSYILDKQNEYLPKLKDIWDSLIRMETRGMSLAGGGGQNFTFDFSGATFGGSNTQASVEAAFKIAVEKFKRQGLN